jgi:hypothetical protein
MSALESMIATAGEAPMANDLEFTLPVGFSIPLVA